MTDEVTRPDTGDGPPKVEAGKEAVGKAAARAGDVLGEAQDRAGVVARQAKDQLKGLVDRSRDDLGVEAANRSRQAAGSVRTLAGQMEALAQGDSQSAGPLGDLLRDGRDRLQAFAARLDDGPDAVLDDVRRFARRQPAMFLATAGAIGFVTGRLVRAARDASSADRSGPAPTRSSADQELPAPLPPPPALAVAPGAPVVAESTTGLGAPGAVVP